MGQTALATTEPAEPTLADLLSEEARRLDSDLQHIDTDDENAWLPDWYLAQLAQADAVERAVKLQAKRLLAQIDARRKALAWRWGDAFRARVDQDLACQKARRKSFDYATGRAGYRKVRATVLVTDEQAAVDWCVKHCQDALDVKIARRKPITEMVERSGEVPPGVEFVDAREKFYPSVEQPSLEEAEAARQAALEAQPQQQELPE